MQVIVPEPAARWAWLPGWRRSAATADARALEALLAPAVDDSYVLVLSPHIPGVGRDLQGLLVGPGGIRAFLVRRWHGHFRHRGRVWEYDARGRHGWIRCRTDPTYDGRRIVDQLGRWMVGAMGTQLDVEPVIAFPDRASHIELLEDPVTEVVTTDNAPWWGQRLAGARRLEGRWAGRLLEAVLAGT